MFGYRNHLLLSDLNSINYKNRVFFMWMYFVFANSEIINITRQDNHYNSMHMNKCISHYTNILGERNIYIFLWRCDPTRAMTSSFLRFLDHTQRRITVGRTPLDKWSTRDRDLYLTTHNTHNRQTSMPPGGIRTHDLSRRAAADLRLRTRGHWDRLINDLISQIKFYFIVTLYLQGVRHAFTVDRGSFCPSVTQTG